MLDLTSILAFVCAFLSFGMAVAVLVFRERSFARWSFAAGMVLLSVETVLAELSRTAILPGEVVRWQYFRFMTLSFLPGTWLLFSLSYSRGNYREFLASWRFVLGAAFLLPTGLVLGLNDQLMAGTLSSRTILEQFVVLGPAGYALHLVFLLGSVVIVMNLERTFRASIGTMRWRIKYLLLGVGVLFAGRIYTSSQSLLFSAIDPSLELVNCAALLLGCALIVVSLIRAGHFNVDVYPSRAVLSSSLTFILAGLYLLIVGGVAEVVSHFGGTKAFALKVFLVLISLVILVLLLLSERLRQRVKRFVSRHFKRPTHDYRRAWTLFTARTNSLVETPDLCRAVAQLVSDRFNVLAVTLWLVDERQERMKFGGSTSLTECKAIDLAEVDKGSPVLISALRTQTRPLNIETTSAEWIDALKKLNPGQFRRGGDRVCVPLCAGGEVLGVMTLADRVNAMPFSEEEFDLLKCIGDQVAGNLQNIRLSEKLLRAKEMAAFQTMSTFFVHDLKNVASSLSLTLQNFPAHYDDPGFREDALGAIAKNVSRINGLVNRLGLLRQSLDMNKVEVDLNEVVGVALAGLDSGLRQNLREELRPVPKVSLDPDQLQKVITNLVINATEAVNEGGEIRVETAPNDGWAMLTVSDNGCGMSRQFLNESLFRPFQTTKKNGIGIGMFQSKLIIDAHQGKIEVESEPGKGTTFRVLLPLQEKRV